MNSLRFSPCLSVRGLATAVCVWLLIAGSSISPARDTADSPGQFNTADYKFAKAAATSALAQVTLGNLAAQHSVNPTIQGLAKRMVDDNSRANTELQQLALKKGATLPAQPTAEQQKHIERLSHLTRDDFDEEFIALIIRDHKVDEKEFKHAADKSRDRELKAFAEYNLRVVQEHLHLAESLEQNYPPNSSRR